MKKLAVLFIVFFLVIICSAQSVQIETKEKKEGDRTRQISKEYVVSATTNDRLTAWYVDKIYQAMAKPGSFILIRTSKKVFKMVGLFRVLEEVRADGIMYDSISKKIVFVQKKQQQEAGSPLLAPGLISLFFMILSHVLLRVEKNDGGRMETLSYFFAVIAGMVAVGAAVFAALTLFFVALIMVIIAAILALVVGAGGYEYNQNIIMIIGYYVMIVLHFMMLWLGI